ncbi:MAG: 50S ribosomal protein L22 [Deltaproteobacteria bacterium]|nr:50S ribosomal protein L22 [Deltaproteobacteria bacterium]
MRASIKFLRISPRKVRLVADMIRGKKVEEALSILQFTLKSSAKPLAKLVKSAVANADQQGGINVDKLVVQKIWADGGPTIKRFMPRAMGRASPIRHRTSNVTVELEQQES